MVPLAVEAAIGVAVVAVAVELRAARSEEVVLAALVAAARSGVAVRAAMAGRMVMVDWETDRNGERRSRPNNLRNQSQFCRYRSQHQRHHRHRCRHPRTSDTSCHTRNLVVQREALEAWEVLATWVATGWTVGHWAV